MLIPAARSAVRFMVLVVTGVSAVCCVFGAGDEELPLYVGRQTCMRCHAPAGSAQACGLEAIPAHDRAYEALARPVARHIAALCGVGESPRQSRLCLGCHATSADAGPRWTTETFDIADGVQCEACHGPGSLHAAGRHQEDGGDRWLDQGRRMRSVDRSECITCHVRRPSHEAVLEKGYRRPDVDAAYATPVNLVPSPDGKRLYVVCANRNEVAVADPGSGAVLARIPVGRRPHDIAVSPDGRTIYVTNRLADSLSVVDTDTLAVVAEIAVGDEPHGVLADAAGERIFVVNTGQDSISIIDASERAEVRRLAAGRGPWSLALRGDGALCVTNTWPHPAPFREPHRSEMTLVAAGSRGRIIDRPIVAGASMLQGVAVVPGRDVVLFTLMRVKNLVPVTRLTQGWTITNGLGVLWPDGRVDQVLLDEPGESFPDPTDVAVSPDGRYALVTSGGTDQVAVVDVARLLETVTAASDRERSEVLPDHLGMSRRFVLGRIAVGSNPRGVAFAPDGRFAYVANALDDSVTVIETAAMTALRTIDLGGPGEISETRRGAKLFFSAHHTFGRQFSCSSCHPDGHINGLTFDIEPDGIGMNPVDNRTLRGIFDTAPFKWEGNNPTLHRQCGPRLAVFFTRVDPFTPEELDALVRYISTIERPPNRHRRPEGLTLAERRGKAIFERSTTNFGEPIHPEQRCSTCHGGPYGTSTAKVHVGTTMWFDSPVEPEVVDLADLSADIEQNGALGLYYFVDVGSTPRRWDVPHLTNIHDSPPYLHNGAAATLEEIWTRYDVLMQHGVTNDLTRQQFNDLIAYLKTL